MYKTELDHEPFNFSEATPLPNRDSDSCTLTITEVLSYVYCVRYGRIMAIPLYFEA